MERPRPGADMWLLLLLLVAASTPASPRNHTVAQVQGVVGETVFLPCDTALQLDQDSVLLILWYRQHLGTPIYSVDARKGDLVQAERWADESVFGSRAYFVSDQQPALLGIDRLQERDADVYRCRVDYRLAQTRNSWTNVSVIVPPGEMTLVDADGGRLSSVVGPLPEGAVLLLYCHVTGGKPRPGVKWYRDGTAVEGHLESSEDAVRVELRLASLARADLGSSLRCEATNNNRSKPLASTLRLDMNLAPLDVRIVGGGQPLSAGRRYDLLCVSTGSRPPATLTWWRSGVRLEASKDTVSEDGNATTSMLSLRPTRQDSGKQLSCRAENSALPAHYRADGWKLDVHYSPEVQLQLGKSLTPASIQEGMDVYFDCVIKANPPAYKVEWRHKGEALHQDAGRGVIVSNQSLVLQSVGRNSSGGYSCLARNSHGDGKSGPFLLNVMYVPECRRSQPGVLGASRRERVNVSCEVEANPRDVSFSWLFNNTGGSVELSGARQRGTTSTLEYTPLHETDYGTLQCRATNRAGPQRAPCVFHVVPAGRPEAVRDCAANTTATALALSCEAGGSGGLPQVFRLRVADARGEVVAELTSRQPLFSVGQLQPGRPYLLTVTSVNPKGAAPPISLPAATLPLPRTKRSELDPRVWWAAVSAAAALAALVACSCIAGLRRCPSRRRVAVCRKKHAVKTTEVAGDENNPDVVPQPRAEEGEGDPARPQKLVVSTIETLSPRASLEATHGRYLSYCALGDAPQPHGAPSQETQVRSE